MVFNGTCRAIYETGTTMIAFFRICQLWPAVNHAQHITRTNLYARPASRAGLPIKFGRHNASSPQYAIAVFIQKSAWALSSKHPAYPDAVSG